MTTDHQAVVVRNVEEELTESYLRYSMSVIIARALPDVRDGLKPSQRRVLYAMRQLNLGPTAKYRKCAKICGDTSGDYHPHGEQVIYPTLYRMAQEWAMRYMLIEGQGNFGSVDGDPPAAMRYTEARMTRAAMHLMDELDQDTVDTQPNYDDTKREPLVLPSRIPNLLANGSSGIAVGMATTIPPHNIGELIDAAMMVLDDRNVSIDSILQVMPGPDFPTGGTICGYRGIREAFHTGHGKLVVRARIEVEPHPTQAERQVVVVDQLPYNVTKATVVEHVADLVNNKQITGISDLRDESDKSGMRIVFELKKGEIPEVVINQLYKMTQLQTTFACHMLALDKGMPRIMNIRQMISAWLDHRMEVVRRRTRYELAKAEARAHILEGYVKALDHLDEVVKLIRGSESREAARDQLMARYSLSLKQAHAVLDLRLFQLTGLERDKIEKELAALQKAIEEYRAILASEEKVKDILREEMLQVKKDFPSPRRTQIIAAESELQMEDLIAQEEVAITLSSDDYIRRMSVDAFRAQRRGGSGVMGFDQKRETDEVKELYVASTHDHLLVFTDQGRCYWLRVWQIPETGRRSKGKPLIQLLESIQPNEKVATILRVSSFEDPGSILMVTRKGVIKKTELAAYGNPRKKGIIAINIDEGDSLIAARLVHEKEQVMLFTRRGMAVRFDSEAVRSVGRVARGVRGVSLRGEEDRVVSAEVVSSPEDTVLLVCDQGFGKRSKVGDFRKTARGGVGVKAIVTSGRNGPLMGAIRVEDTDNVILMSRAGQAVRLRVKEIRVMGRATQGVKLFQLREEEDELLAVQRLAVDQAETPSA
jgi:DNA gyrase subunit A